MLTNPDIYTSSKAFRQVPDDGRGPHRPAPEQDPPRWAPDVPGRWLVALLGVAAVAAGTFLWGPGSDSLPELMLPVAVVGWLLVPFMTGWLLGSGTRAATLARLAGVAAAQLVGMFVVSAAMPSADIPLPVEVLILQALGVPAVLGLGLLGHGLRGWGAVATSATAAGLSSVLTGCSLILAVATLMSAPRSSLPSGVRLPVLVAAAGASALGSYWLQRWVGRAGRRQLTWKLHLAFMGGALLSAVTITLGLALATALMLSGLLFG